MLPNIVCPTCFYIYPEGSTRAEDGTIIDAAVECGYISQHPSTCPLSEAPPPHASLPPWRGPISMSVPRIFRNRRYRHTPDRNSAPF